MTTEAQKAGQVELNIDFYVKVYKKCLEEAEAIAHDKNWGAEEAFKIAETIFKQFFVDQTAIAGQARQTEAMVSGLHSVLESRGR